LFYDAVTVSDYTALVVGQQENDELKITWNATWLIGGTSLAFT
jgi:hypothetical protein